MITHSFNDVTLPISDGVDRTEIVVVEVAGFVGDGWCACCCVCSGFWSERITNAFRYNPYFKAAGAIIAFAYGGPEGVVLYSAGLASLSGASDEDVLKAAVGLYIISSAAAGINTSVSNVILRATSYGILGGASSLISDGNFADGFVIGIIGSIANGYMRQTGGLAGRTTIVAISGGVIEELGRGKFINGATSTAFAYLFSESIKPELMQMQLSHQQL
jgi:hypothetical protein